MTRTGRSHRRPSTTRTATAFVTLAGTLLAGPLLAPQASAVSVRQVPVVNGDFSAPNFTASGSGDKLTGWIVAYPYRLLPADARHPDGLPAVLLRNKRATDQSVSQRLRGVRSGAQVTVTFDDSTGGLKSACSKDQIAGGQPYTLQGSGGTRQTFTTDPGSTDWHRDRTYTFTANENEPLITFASAQTRGSWDCGPLLAKVRATDVPPPVDQTIDKNALPAPEAFEGNERINPRTAADHCANSRNTCTFTVDGPYSYTYYDKARVVGEAYLNCTRNTVNHDRPVRFTGGSYDSLSQREDIDRLSNSKDNLHQQFTRGFAKSSPEPWHWDTATNRTIHETIEAGEASWIEGQAGRQRVDGWFVGEGDAPDKQIRLHVVADGPSALVPDRVYQRTGPFTAAEKSRCRSDRPTAATPVDAGAPAIGTDRGSKADNGSP
ncbi:hypothetical protein [Streptomyces sp. 769]|uniref:hypothetical protein n=1 Tax=Streptomyces sp. 769 TaxID=1262452 RepID=UPI000581E62C|nr:hypothetical protein [Streptomyces sp. 769]AJC60730.1 hypothetical protein GZL_08190 [Streptomyces sp. 769]